MSRLVRLYPRAWRSRYEAEFTELLAECPPSAIERLDIIRGAVDARLHPQLTGVTRESSAGPAGLRRTGAIAVGGGLLWALASVGFYAAPYVPAFGYKDGGSIALVAAIAAGLTGLAALMLVGHVARRSVVLRGSAAVVLIGAVGLALPWPVLIVGFFGVMFGTVAYALIGATRFGAVYLFVAFGALTATAFNTEDDRALLLIPLGAAWILAGAMTIRDASALSLRLESERLSPP